MWTVRWGMALGLGALWWWGVLRLALTSDAALGEAAVAAGGNGSPTDSGVSFRDLVQGSRDSRAQP